MEQGPLYLVFEVRDLLYVHDVWNVLFTSYADAVGAVRQVVDAANADKFSDASGCMNVPLVVDADEEPSEDEVDVGNLNHYATSFLVKKLRLDEAGGPAGAKAAAVKSAIRRFKTGM